MEAAAGGIQKADVLRRETESGRLLVVDDNELNRDLLARRLRQQGHTVTTATNGREALALVATGGFDVVLLDVMMPEMDGFQVLERLRDDGTLFRTPVIMISALGELESVARCIELGATDYLPKPFDPVLLRARVSATLERKRLRDRERLHATQLERELEIGRQIQTHFFPDTLPQPPGWEVAARFHPARQVAGDFYDVFAFGPGNAVALVLADVCGKGVGAALFMAVFRSLVRAAASHDAGTVLPGQTADAASDPEAALSYAIRLTNDYIARTHTRANMFATMFFGVLDPDAGSLAYVNGGHEAPILLPRGGGEFRRLTPTGPAVGLFPDLPFAIGRTELAPGDLLIAFTDGVTEAQNAAGDFYNEERLLDLLSEPAGSGAEVLDRIERSVLEHTGEAERSDDIALLAVRRADPPEAPPGGERELRR